MPLNIIFAGTPDFAAHHLQTLIDSEHNIVGVYSQPDRPANRGKSLQASPVKQKALEYDLDVYQPPNFKELNDQQVMAELNADIMVVVAYGLLLPKVVLDIPKFGCINVHASLLPRWRGAAPIQRAVEAGDSHSGVTIMQMDIGLDTGDMLLVAECKLDIDETGGSLHDKLLELGGPALLDALQQIEAGTARPIVQDDSLKTYAHKFNKDDAAIDWSKPAAKVERLIRAYRPFPVAHCGFEDKGKMQRLRIWQASIDLSSAKPSLPGVVEAFDKSGLTVGCGNGTRLKISQVQLPGKKAMSVKDLLNGRADLFTPGQQLN